MLFNHNMVFTKQAFTSKHEVIQFLAERALESGYLKATENYIASIYKRELEFSTAIGNDVAIPHGSHDDVLKSFVAVASLEKPIIWDESEVEIVFMIGVSSTKRATEHLKILSKLARHLMHGEFRKSILESKSSDELFNVLEKIEEDSNE